MRVDKFLLICTIQIIIRKIKGFLIEQKKQNHEKATAFVGGSYDVADLLCV